MSGNKPFEGFKQKLIDENEITDLFALAQSLPGVLAVNSSMLIGYKVTGLAGAFAAALGIILPSLAAMCAVALLYTNFIDNAYVAGALRGMSAAVVALLLTTVLNLRKRAVGEGFIGWIMAGVTLAVCILFPSLNFIWLIISGAIIGLIIMSIQKRRDIND